MFAVRSFPGGCPLPLFCCKVFILLSLGLYFIRKLFHLNNLGAKSRKQSIKPRFFDRGSCIFTSISSLAG